MTRLLSLCLVAATLAAQAQPAPSPAPDPLSLPAARPTPGAYQWGIEMLKFDRAWAITRGRAHMAFPDTGVIPPHEDLRAGIEGPLRLHVSQPMVGSLPWRYHSTLTVGVAAARGMNGRGIAGACPFCSVSLHNAEVDRAAGLADAIESGAAVVNFSAGGNSTGSCDTNNYNATVCAFNRRAEERDVVNVSIAGNSFQPYGAGVPGGSASVIVVAGLQHDGRFWSQGYENSNRGSDYGAGIRLVAPSRDVLTTHPIGGVYGTADYRCGDRVDSTLGTGVRLGMEYTGYGDCQGTSFSAPWVSALAALMRSANPLLTAAEVREIIYATATTPVAGPEGSGLTFYIPDAEAAVKRAIGTGLRNRTTPMFRMFAAGANAHLFTTSPQTAVAAAAGELRMNGFNTRPVYESVGGEIAGYSHFAGRICAVGTCRKVPARSDFEVFTTENSPDGRELAPLYRLSRACTENGCPAHRTFTYATSATDVATHEALGWALDVIEGYVYARQQAMPPGALSLCMAQDGRLHVAASCASPAEHLGYVPTTPLPRNWTGLYWNAAENGWGINFSHQGDIVFGTLFTYDADGRPMWLVLSDGRRQGETDTYEGTLYRVAGFELGSSSRSVAATSVGEMRVAFAGDGASLEYTVSGTRVTKQVQKQVFGARAAECREFFGERMEASNYQDLWFNASEPGWGLNVTQQGTTVFATLFTYDAAGRDLWYVMSAGQRQADGSFLGALYRTRGPVFNAVPFTPITGADVTDVGTLRLRFLDAANGTMTFALSGSVAVEKAITRQIFARPAVGCRN